MKCKKCGSDGPFYDSAKEGSEAYGTCKPCMRGVSAQLGKAIKKARKTKQENVVAVPCRVCKRDLPSTDFSPSAVAGILLGFPNSCRVCRRPLERAKWEKRKQALTVPDDYSDLV